MKDKPKFTFGIVTASSVDDERFDEIYHISSKRGTATWYLNSLFFTGFHMARREGYKLDQEHGLGVFLKSKSMDMNDFMVGLANLYGHVYLQKYEAPVVFIEDEDTGEVLEVGLGDWTEWLR